MLSRRGLLAASAVGLVGGPGYLKIRDRMDYYRSIIEACEEEYGEDGYEWVDGDTCVDADSPRAQGVTA